MGKLSEVHHVPLQLRVDFLSIVLLQSHLQHVTIVSLHLIETLKKKINIVRYKLN